MKQLNPFQQQELNNKILSELKKITLSWCEDLKEWHRIAIEALRFASCESLNISPSLYKEILKTQQHGVNAVIVSILCNNIERRTPAEMNVSVEEFINIIELNQKIAAQWEDICNPIRQKVIKDFENSQPKNLIHKI